MTQKMKRVALQYPVEGPNYYKFFKPLYFPVAPTWDEIGQALGAWIQLCQMRKSLNPAHPATVNAAIFGPQD